ARAGRTAPQARGSLGQAPVSSLGRRIDRPRAPRSTRGLPRVAAIAAATAVTNAPGRGTRHRGQRASLACCVSRHAALSLHGPPPARMFPQARLRLESSRLVATLIAPARCERLDAAGREAIVARLGPDPLRADADPDRALAFIAQSRAPIGALLL